MQVDGGKLGDDQVEAVGFVQLLDVLGEAEVLDDLTGLGGERLDVVRQVLGDVVRIARKRAEVELARVVQRKRAVLGPIRWHGRAVEHRLQVVDRRAPALQLLRLRPHLLARGFKDAVEPTQHGQREDDLAVLVGAVRAAEQIRDLPDQGDLVAEVVHGGVGSAIGWMAG